PPFGRSHDPDAFHGRAAAGAAPGAGLGADARELECAAALGRRPALLDHPDVRGLGRDGGAVRPAAAGAGPGELAVHRALLAAALLSGAFIAGYMVSDGAGVRLAGRATSYIAWMSLVQGLPMPFVYWAIRRRWPPLANDRETWKALGGGVISIVAYGVVVWAM